MRNILKETDKKVILYRVLKKQALFLKNNYLDFYFCFPDAEKIEDKRRG